MSSIFAGSLFDEPLFDEHLCLDAVVAFADGEMRLVAYQRAAAHLQHCAECAAEVDEQTAARAQLRSVAGPSMPQHLRASLQSIPALVDDPERVDEGTGRPPSQHS